MVLDSFQYILEESEMNEMYKKITLIPDKWNERHEFHNDIFWRMVV